MSLHNEVSTVEIKTNKDRETDIDYALRYTRFFLSCIGIWPLVSSNSTRIERIVSKFLKPYCSITMVLFVMPIYLQLTLRDVSTTERILLIGPVCFVSANILKYFILIFHWDLTKLCVQQMEIDWRRIKNQNDRDIAMKNLKIGRNLSLTCAVSMYVSGVIYVILMPFYSGKTVNELNETVRPLVYPGNDIIIDLQAGFNYEIVFCNNCIASFMNLTVFSAVFNLISLMVTHACGQLQTIISRLENLVEETDVHTIKNRIAFIVRRHVSVLKFSSRIDKLFQEICLTEVVVSTIFICMLEYCCLLEWRNGNKFSIITYGIILVTLFMNIFIYCYVGELLKEQCERVGIAAYMIEWYRLPSKTGLALIMIMTTSYNPCRLTAGRIIELSMVTFGKIVKSSFAYLGMLDAVAEE